MFLVEYNMRSTSAPKLVDGIVYYTGVHNKVMCLYHKYEPQRIRK